ncbi:MAG: tRNA-dihydrouridine synthase [Patescibacteria group bacterium]
MHNVWTDLKKPIIGLGPMDGITDPAYREIVDIYGHPDLLFTEFAPAEGITHKVTPPLRSLIRHQTKTPLIAQLFGSDPKSFYKAFFIVAEMGYDGIDINMGCPDSNIMKKRGGGAFIGRPTDAKEIIKIVQRAANDWKNGKTIGEAGLREEIIIWIKTNRIKKSCPKKIPVSIKTRTGIDKHITKEWISTLLDLTPSAIILHGRTLRQMYHGKADWDEIEKAALLAKHSETVIIGSGDIISKKQAITFAKKYKVDGVLIARAALGNPWIFSDKKPTQKEIYEAIIKHCNLFIEYQPRLKLYPMRKHLAWYIKGIKGSRALRNRLVQVVTLEDVKTIFKGTLI